MATLAEIRQQYPQYNDMSDSQLADAMYKAHYSDVPRDQFNAKIGMSAQPSGPQPTLLDRAIASPVGRAIHDNIVGPAAGMVGSVEQQASMNPITGAIPALMSVLTHGRTGAAPAASVVNSAVERPYQGALQSNRNTPGYPAQRALADKAMQGRGGSGFTDQMTSGFNPSLAGLGGLLGSGGSLDASNAMADAQQQGQNTYQQAHPLRSMGASALGSLLMMPERGPVPPAPAAVPNQNLRPGAWDAHQAGYVLPPSMASEDPGALANGLAGWSGKIKTAQAASEANQEVTNTLAAKSIGLNPDDGISEAALSRVRSDAGKAYGAVSKALPVTMQDPEFVDAIGGISDKTSSLAESFPNITKNADIENLVGDLTNAKSFKTEDGIKLVRQLRKDATANFKAAADPSKLALAQAQRDAAEHIDDLIQRNLAKTGQEGLVSDYQAARQTIAKTYDLQSATNLTTGNVNAHRLAALAARGRPLTGELDTIASAASAFPKAMQPLDRIGGVEPLSTLDLGAAALSAAHGNYGVGAALLGKPFARAAVLGDRMQQGIMSGVGKELGGPALQLPALTARSRVPLLLPLMLQQQAQSQPSGR